MWLVLLALAACGPKCAACIGCVGVISRPDSILEMLLSRIEESPDHADSWRLLGKHYARIGDDGQALESLRRALELDPSNAAAHFNVGEFYLAQDNSVKSVYHFQQVLAIAPDSSYASRVREMGVEPSRDLESGTGIVWPSTSEFGVDRQAQTAKNDLNLVDEANLALGTATIDRDLNSIGVELEIPYQRYRAGIELGTLYNSNVSLTPISRQLEQVDAGGFQFIANPDFQYDVWKTESAQAGVQGYGYFSLGESHIDDFNLASFQPGLFVEREGSLLGQDAILRTEYSYAIDLLGGSSIGDRHSISTSVSLIHAQSIDVLYGAVSFTDFRVDGVLPQTTSLDGTTWGVGASRFFVTGKWRIPLWSIGASGEIADTEGSDFRYRSMQINSDATFNLNQDWSAVPSLSIGHRWYQDFTGTPERDELVWRAGLELRRQISEQLYVALLASTDEFVSEHPDFDIERYMTGLVFRWRN